MVNKRKGAADSREQTMYSLAVLAMSGYWTKCRRTASTRSQRRTMGMDMARSRMVAITSILHRRLTLLAMCACP
uniref:Uncharacterized protein n=1 Tax=Arundo donax TaxID=35708 RepID=A0A0A9BUG4_ARUDO